MKIYSICHQKQSTIVLRVYQTKMCYIRSTILDHPMFMQRKCNENKESSHLNTHRNDYLFVDRRGNLLVLYWDEKKAVTSNL